MITTLEQYRALMEEVLELQDKLEKLGAVRVLTTDGQYAMFECALSPYLVPAQKEYCDCKKELEEKKRIINAYDTIIRLRDLS